MFNNGFKCAVSKKDFSFSVNNMLLKIIGNILPYTKIFKAFRHFISLFFTKLEESINRCLGRKNNGGVIGNINFLCPKLSESQGFQLEKWFKVNCNSILAN